APPDRKLRAALSKRLTGEDGIGAYIPFAVFDAEVLDVGLTRLTAAFGPGQFVSVLGCAATFGHRDRFAVSSAARALGAKAVMRQPERPAREGAEQKLTELSSDGGAPGTQASKHPRANPPVFAVAIEIPFQAKAHVVHHRLVSLLGPRKADVWLDGR